MTKEASIEGKAGVKRAIQNGMMEWSFPSGKTYADPFHDVAPDVGWQIHHRGQAPFAFTSGIWGEYEDWRDIAAFPGSGQMQHCRWLLERYAWWRFEPRADWLEIAGENDGCFVPHAAGIPRQVRVIYLPPPSYAGGRLCAVVGLEPDVSYRASFYDPRCGAPHDLGVVRAEAGRWRPPRAPNMQDWVIVLETDEAGKCRA